jgi:hypothetical protein
MKGHLGLHVAAFLTLWVPGAWAQSLTTSQPVSRVDVTGVVAWLNANKSDLSSDPYNDWYNRAAFVGIGGGWYWTDHLKTEVDGGVSSRVTLRVYSNVNEPTRQVLTQSEYAFSTRRIGVAQQYQFGRNAWFHPWVSAGVDVTWEQIDEDEEIITTFDQTRQWRTERGPGEPRRTEVSARPFAALGFKTYLAPRTFFRTDMKFVFHGGVDEVLLRFGLGVDF